METHHTASATLQKHRSSTRLPPVSGVNYIWGSMEYAEVIVGEHQAIDSGL